MPTGNLNVLKEDFDKDKVQGMTFAKWGELYLERYASTKRSQQEDARHVAALGPFFGTLTLSQITRAHVEAFRQARQRNQKSHVGEDQSEDGLSAVSGDRYEGQ
jgi:hypothetical protein